MLAALRQALERLDNILSHKLPDEAKSEGAIAVDDISALNVDEGEAVVRAQGNGIVTVLNLFEARERLLA